MAGVFLVDWLSESCDVLANPRMPAEDLQQLALATEEQKHFPAHVWLATSGSSGRLKWVALAKQALLASAQAVNVHLQSTAEDTWLNPLPIFHVGGLSIWARSFLSGAKVMPYVTEDGRWHPQRFVEQLITSNATLTSLVPAQVFDLVTLKIPAPKGLQGIIVGGGALAEKIYSEAIATGWKLLPSYGLTECASQVATAALESCTQTDYPKLIPLQHVELAVDGTGYLKIKSTALLTAYIYLSDGVCRVVDPKVDGWLTTEDRVTLEEGKLCAIGRGEYFVKVGGESVDLLRLEKILDEEKLALAVAHDVVLIALPDARLGHAIHLVVADAAPACVSALVERFACRVFPFERIRGVHCVAEIPRSAMKKVLRAALLAQLS